jgi:hypothetical protein
MTDWSTISDDEFVEEAQRRVNPYLETSVARTPVPAP